MQAEVWSEKQVKSANKQIENFYFLFYLPCDLIGGVWFCVTMVYFFVTGQRYTYRVLQTIQMNLILLCVWAERAVLGSAKTALKFKYEI